jgi:hypothetical protein
MLETNINKQYNNFEQKYKTFKTILNNLKVESN